MELNEIKFDCRHFRGGIPCGPNKKEGKVCPSCDAYSPITKRILIIKLGALGDVIRTTPLVTRFRKEYPGCHITWITLSPAILPKNKIDEILPMDFVSVYGLQHRSFDIAINLDKELEACALLADVKAERKFGFIWKDNQLDIANPAAKHKVITGLFDNISQTNTKSYLEEIFEICEMDFRGEEYLLDISPVFAEKWTSLQAKANGKIIVGLNTGCGQRWLTRLWREDYWLDLIKALENGGFYPVLLGGKDEDEQNQRMSKASGAYYPGTFSLEEFIALTSRCDIVVSAVSMMMHIAVGLQKPLILFNNIFNPNEFHLYGRGEIVQPETGCECYYGNSCKRTDRCMNHLKPETVYQAIQRHASAKA